MKSRSAKSLRRKALEKKWGPILQNSPSAEEFQQAYDEEYALFVEEKGLDLRESKLDQLHQVMISRVGTGKSVLEIGCGDGAMCFALAKQGNTVIGIDVSKIVLEQATAKLREQPRLNLKFEFGDARALDFAESSFDYVISRNLVEHLSAADAHRHMREVWRVLKDEGCYLCFVPSRIYKGYRSAGFHLQMYSLGEMIELASSCGFRVRWIEPKFRRLGIKGEMPPVITSLFLWYEKGLGLLKRACPRLELRAGKYRITPTILIAAYKRSLTP